MRNIFLRNRKLQQAAFYVEIRRRSVTISVKISVQVRIDLARVARIVSFLTKNILITFGVIYTNCTLNVF